VSNNAATITAQPLGKIIIMYGGKGGAGKTTSSYELAVAVVRAGFRVLLVDLDGGQASLSAKVGIDVTQLKYGLYEAIKDLEKVAGSGILRTIEGRKEVWEKVRPSIRLLAGEGFEAREGRLAILANNMRLAALEYEWVNATQREMGLKRFLGYFSPRFDFTIVDCPANRGILTVNALVAGDYLAMPIETSSIGFHGATSMLGHPEDLFLPRITGRSWGEEMGRLGINPENWNSQTDFKVTEAGTGKEGDNGEEDWVMADTTAALNPNLRISAVIPSRYDKELADNRLVLEKLTRIFGLNSPDGYQPPGLLMPYVPYSGIYQTSFRQKKTAQELRGHHKGVWDYIASQHIKLAKGVRV